MHNQEQLIRNLYAANLISYGLVVLLLAGSLHRNKQYNKLANMTKYLAMLLEKSDIVLDEFDVIALTNLGITVEEADINEE